jgi:hypothetical protein
MNVICTLSSKRGNPKYTRDGYIFTVNRRMPNGVVYLKCDGNSKTCQYTLKGTLDDRDHFEVFDYTPLGALFSKHVTTLFDVLTY